MNQKELTKTFMMISNRKKTLVSMIFRKKFGAVKVKGFTFERLNSSVLETSLGKMYEMR